MKIEITDKEAWAKRVQAAIDHILARRKEEDGAYEAAWAAKYDAKPRWRRALFGPTSRIPSRTLDWDEAVFIIPYYPSKYAWGDLKKLRLIKAALDAPDTGAVYLTGDEVRAIL